MCRFVIVVIFVSCVSFGVLAEGDPVNITATNTTCTKHDPELNAKRLEWHKCFNNTVQRHLKPDVPVTGDCHTASAFGEKMDSYINLVNTKCNKTLSLNTKLLIKFIEFSLKNDSFRKLYDDIKCVKQYEYNISNNCVKAKVGFFNVTLEKKHSSWATKANLIFNRASCSTSVKVRNCVQAVLHNCRPDTEEYMAKLFNYAQELGNCSQYPDTVIPSPSGTAPLAPWLTTPICLLAVLIYACLCAEVEG